jgi:sulfide:quinone oxidoreductase
MALTEDRVSIHGEMTDITTRVLIAGGGVAALEATLALQALAADRVRIEVVAPEESFVYRPLAVAEPFGAGHVHRFPLAALVEAAGASLRPGLVTSVDPDRRLVRTRDRAELPYDALLLALGARPQQALPGALTFRGPEDGPALASVLDQALARKVRSLIFALPGGVSWPLPLYELAFLTQGWLANRGAADVEVSIVTPEEAPLAVFGAEASEAVAGMLDARGIAYRLRTTPMRVDGRILRLAPDGRMAAGAVVALPRLMGPRLAGIESDASGFVPTDEHGRVGSEVDVYAAGDLTQFPLKQGGIAAQQADAAAAAIAVQAGAAVDAPPFRPILRGLLLTGDRPSFLRTEVAKAGSVVAVEPLWWPPAKIVGRHLAPFLAEHLGLSVDAPSPPVGSVIRVERELRAKAGYAPVSKTSNRS